MLRADAIRACNTIRETLEATGLVELLQSALSPRAREGSRDQNLINSSSVLDVYARFMSRAASFDDPKRQVVKIFKLENLLKVEWWSGFLSYSSGMGSPPERAPGQQRYMLSRTYENIRFTLEHVPKSIALLKHNYEAKQLQAGENQTDRGDFLVLTVLLFEKPGELSSPDRLVTMLQSVRELYDVCATLQWNTSTDLAVVACDAGSDKSFDFLGSAKAIQHMKEIVISMWNSIIYFQETKFEKRVRLVAESLPILEQIDGLQKNKKNPREQAELLRRGIVNGVMKFMECGASIPEVNSITAFQLRNMIQAQPKLLLDGPVNSKNIEDVTETDDAQLKREDSLLSDVSPEERERLVNLLRQIRSDNDQTEN